MLIYDFKAIAQRSRQIANEEGRFECHECKDIGWKIYFADEFGPAYSECSGCGNPYKKAAPHAC